MTGSSTRLESGVITSIIEGMPMGVGVLDANGQFVFVNNELCLMLLATQQDILDDRPPYRHWRSGQGVTHEQLMGDIAAGRAQPVVVTYQRRDGTLFPCRVSPSTSRIGNAQLHLVVFEDLTDQKNQVEELANLRGHIEAMTDRGEIATWEWSAATGSTVVSDSYYTMLGFEPGAFEINEEARRASIHPDDVERATTSMDDLLESRASLYEVQYRMRDASGQWHWVLSRGYIVGLDEDDHPTGVRGTQVSINRLKLQEERLVQLQNMELLGQLSAGIAHDFNNILAVLRLNLRVLDMEATDATRPILDDMSMSLQRADAMIRTLIQNRGGATPPAPSTMRVGPAIARAERVLRTPIEAGQELVMRVDCPDATIRVDPGSLENALLNLVVNARDALRDTGGLIEITAERHTLEAGSKRVQATPAVVFSVRDTGSGMDEHVRARATRPLFTTKAKGEGTGLGLAMVARFVHDTGGEMNIESTPNVGTVVSLAFPVVDEVERSTQEETAPLPGSETLVVVDDETRLLAALEPQLTSLGYRVHTFDDPGEALSFLRNNPAELLLTDIFMPFTMGGVELVRQSLEHDPNLKVVFMTAFAGERGADARGMGPIVSKPFTMYELTRQIRASLDDPPSLVEDDR